MKISFTLMTFLFILSSVSAGVGGIAGGTGPKKMSYQMGDHIEFQKYSTYVSARFNSTLCHDEVEYTAVTLQCADWGEDRHHRRVCLKMEPVQIYQPIESSRVRCGKFDDDRNCIKWIEVKFNQSPKREYNVKDQDGKVIEVKKVIIPNCEEIESRQ